MKLDSNDQIFILCLKHNAACVVNVIFISSAEVHCAHIYLCAHQSKAENRPVKPSSGIVSRVIHHRRALASTLAQGSEIIMVKMLNRDIFHNPSFVLAWQW